MNEPTILALFFLFVMAAVAGAGWIFLTRMQERAEESASVPDAAPESTQDLLKRALRTVGEAVPGSKQDTNPMRQLLQKAGYRHPSALATFYGVKIALAVMLGVALGMAGQLNAGEGSAALIALGAGAGFGYLLPDRALSMMVRARASRIREAIPSALDLIVLCVEAGQSLNQALSDAAGELKDAYPDLSAELAQVHLELRAGKDRAAALMRMAQRTAEPELRKLASVLIDSDRFGTSLAPALRTHAKYLRTRQRQRAQEAARKVAVKLVFPVFFLIFPSVLLVTLGPAVLKMMTQLKAFTGEL